MTELYEGLRESDLVDLVVPMMSIDEYETKISNVDEVIVVGFFVDDKEPAIELSRFIDRSVQNILDTDVSPAPNESGYFMMFLELKRDEHFYEIIKNILHEMENITEIKEWTFKVYKNDEIMDFNEENVRRHIRLNEPTHESFIIKSFFDDALIETVIITESHVQLKGFCFRILDIDSKIMVESTLSLSDMSLSRRLDNMLGLHYNTTVNGESIQIRNNLMNRAIMLSL